MRKNIFVRLWQLWMRELAFFSRRPMMLVVMFFAPVLLLLFFISLMGAGLPTDLPAGIVDEDDTSTTRTLVRTLDAMENTDLRYRYSTFSEAREAMQRGEIYAFFHIPRGTTERALGQRQPKIGFYTNESYLIAGSLLMRDMRTASEMIGMGVSRQTFVAKGMGDDAAMAAVRPIAIEAHPIGNAVLDYSVYLSNIIVPGCIMLLVMIFTPYTIGLEWKRNDQRKAYNLAGRSTTLFLAGKLIPQTLLFSLMMLLCDVVFYKYLHFPCRGGLWMMWGIGVLCILAAQAFGVFVYGLLQGNMRFSMCVCSLWGIVSFSISGLSFPTMAMSPLLQAAAWLFPLRHYYLLYVNQALHGYSILYAWPSIVALLCFLLLPLLTLPLYRYAFRHAKYKP
ncbi:MAG: ABC transporter permease [Muribaculaceae bacterium]|nr:ABC transporter permease [Muribaculaceae bacterium]